MTDQAHALPVVPAGGTAAPPRPQVRIIPVWGLPIAAVLLLGLIWSISTDSRWGLDFYHVAGGGLWSASTSSWA